MDKSHLLPVAAPQLHQQQTAAKESSKTHPELPILAPETKTTPQRPAIARTVTDELMMPAPTIPGLRKPRKTLVLCFDGTGNKFHGDSTDSNILKIFRMLERTGDTGFHYYQPGIGTYVTTTSLSTTGSLERLKNWYIKMKDSAVGTSFDQHVVGGYRFLMHHYSHGDNIYMFGFSRGSYTARFLSEMLDWVGLITHGNEEMIQFAWRTFSNWKAMSGVSEEAMMKQKKAYEFMVSFRETFSRPVRRIRYLGLFDTVNSVPRFENAMMRRRVHMPYSAKSSAKVIRHAVSIDERRAKFRPDLISPEGRLKEQTDAAKKKHLQDKEDRLERLEEWFHRPDRYKPKKKEKKEKKSPQHRSREKEYREEISHLIHHERYRRHDRSRSHSAVRSSIDRPISPAFSVVPSIPPSDDESSDGDEDDQDIQELWFPGGHGDIGGGWDLKPGEVPFSHVPLHWIVREAKKTGLQFDEEKMKALGCWDEDPEEDLKEKTAHAADVPTIEVTGSPLANGEKMMENGILGSSTQAINDTVDEALKAKIHDCLLFGGGLSAGTTLSWNMMEYIPFRRMDLRDDGSWKPIRWPLPRGEVRDMPSEAKIHHSAIKRLSFDSKYRPGNLIMGGGGRGVRIAPVHAGTGEWVPVKEDGYVDGEAFVRKNMPKPQTRTSSFHL